MTTNGSLASFTAVFLTEAPKAVLSASPTSTPAPIQVSCIWSPKPNGDAECRNLLLSRICSHRNERLGRRFLLLGDSTMGPHHLSKFLPQLQGGHHQLVNKLKTNCRNIYACELLEGDRCRSNEMFGLDYPWNDTWVFPNHEAGEGPISYGLNYSFCSDCAGCYTSIRVCSLVNESQTCLDHLNAANKTQRQKRRRPIVYGGFLKVEFARDVEMQSSAYTTTQENIAAFVNASYNSPGLVRDWGKPICLISTAHHDAAIPNVTRGVYLSNIEWYIRILYPHCESIIWLGATAPLQTVPDLYPQTINQTGY
ncbi:hypothetical protein MPSEU_000980600 [Mayamaea pseudoterrestris]|nr:hypothetical protein MPSEU_000980600 [Mayamaea pseudoterrestris]